MKIAFWSNAFEQANVSFNLAAVSIASVFRFPYTITVVENHLRKDNLGMAYLGTNRAAFLLEAGTSYYRELGVEDLRLSGKLSDHITSCYEGVGIEGLLRQIYRGDLSPGNLKPYIKEIINNHLYYIPQSGVIHSGQFDYEFNHNAPALFNLLEDYADICCINTAPNNNLSSKAILEEADLIVVNLCQNQAYLEDIFANYSSLISKAVFIIGNYSTQSILSTKRISKLYDIPLDAIASIPADGLFHTACLRGRAVEFINSNYMCTKDNPNYLFIHSVKKAAGMIMKKAELCGGLPGRKLSNCSR